MSFGHPTENEVGLCLVDRFCDPTEGWEKQVQISETTRRHNPARNT
jgi:hypothetical protein